VGSRLPSLRRHRRDLPPELCAAIDRALLPRPEDRATLSDLAAALTAAVDEVSDDYGGSDPPYVAPRWLPRLAAGAAAGGLAAVAIVGADEGAAVAAGDLPVATAIAVGLVVALLPRLGWVLAAAGAVAIAGEPGLVAAAVAVPPLLLYRHPLAWSVPAAAPLLGLAGLAGAYPGIAGAARTAWTRAALGAAGLWWLLLAEPLLGRDLLLGTPAGELPDAAALLLAPLWAVAALVQPWLVTGRALSLDIVGATVWAAALAAATATVADAAQLAEPRGLAAGAVLAAAIAISAARARNTVNAEDDRA
jgi:hypothetical protein